MVLVFSVLLSNVWLKNEVESSCSSNPYSRRDALIMLFLVETYFCFSLTSNLLMPGFFF